MRAARAENGLLKARKSMRSFCVPGSLLTRSLRCIQPKDSEAAEHIFVTAAMVPVLLPDFLLRSSPSTQLDVFRLADSSSFSLELTGRCGAVTFQRDLVQRCSHASVQILTGACQLSVKV